MNEQPGYYQIGRAVPIIEVKMKRRKKGGKLLHPCDSTGTPFVEDRCS